MGFIMKNNVILFLAMLLLAPRIWAQKIDIESKPSLYYNEALRYEAEGNLFAAKVAYQTYLIHEKNEYIAEKVHKRLNAINQRLGYEKRYPEKERPRKQCRTKRIHHTRDIVRNAIQPAAIPNSKRPFATVSDECAEKSPNRNQIITATLSKISAKPELSESLQFKTPYTGHEPFLQNCSTPLCRKFHANIKGIECAKAKDYASARKYFNESLRIDPSFATAKYNLALLEGKI